MFYELPTPPEIARIPELAVLSVLLSALEVSVRALVAAHPELEGNTPPPETNAAFGLAQRFVCQAHKLKRLIDSYRRLPIEPPPDDPIPGENEIPW